MAKLGNFLNITGGTLGNLVFYNRNGKTYIRTKPGSISNPKSPAQLAQRQRMQLMNAFLRKFSDPIRLTFAAVPKGKAPYQTAMGYNLRNAFTGEYPNQRIDKSKILLSTGSLPLPLNASLSLHPEGFVIQWEYDFDTSGSTVGDHLVVIVLYKDDSACSFRFTDTRRYEKQYLWKTKQVISPDALPDDSG